MGTSILHGLDCSPEIMISPDDHRYVLLSEGIGGYGGVVGGYQYDWVPVVPGLKESLNLNKITLPTMN
jgi:hypothetical protein